MSNEGTTVACIGLGRMGARFARNSFAERVRFGSEVNARGHEFERLLTASIGEEDMFAAARVLDRLRAALDSLR